MTLRCTSCGAALPDVEPGEPAECEFCGAEQIIADAPDDDLSVEEDSDEEDLWLDDDQCLALVTEHLEELADEYDPEELTVELDDDDTDEDRVYVYVKDSDDEVVEYIYVDREEGVLRVYDYDDEEWVDP